MTPTVSHRDLLDNVRCSARDHPVVIVVGPRRSGRTELCRQAFPAHPYVDLNRREARRFAQEDPRGFLARYPHGALLDDGLQCLDLLPYLGEFVATSKRWIFTGTSDRPWRAWAAGAFAGRVAVHHLLPLTRGEIVRFPKHPHLLDDAILQGGYPGLASRDLSPADELEDLVATFIERDVRRMKNVANLRAFRHFLALCAGRTALPLNCSALAADAGVSQPTARIWLALLEAGHLVFRIPAHRGDGRKYLAKMPKLHFYDTGLACRLLGVGDVGQLRTHPLRGALFETWVASEIVKGRLHRGLSGGVAHYRDHRGTAVPLIIDRDGIPTLVDAKPGATVTSDMLEGIARVRADAVGGAGAEAVVVHGGDQPRERDGIRIVPWSSVPGIAGA